MCLHNKSHLQVIKNQYVTKKSKYSQAAGHEFEPRLPLFDYQRVTLFFGSFCTNKPSCF